MSLEPTAPRPASTFTADEERLITSRPFLVTLNVPHFTARSRPGGLSPFYRPEPLSSGPDPRPHSGTRDRPLHTGSLHKDSSRRMPHVQGARYSFPSTAPRGSCEMAEFYAGVLR